MGAKVCAFRRTYTFYPPDSALSSPVSARAAAHGALDFALGVALGNGFALVIELLAPAEADFDLGMIALEIELEGNQCQPLCLHLADQIVDLAAMQQQLAVAQGVVVHVRSLLIDGDMAAFQPDFAVFDTRKRAAQVHLAVADGFNFCADR